MLDLDRASSSTRGHAYVVEGQGVYFDVETFAGYGELSHRTLEELRESAGARVDVDEAKRSPMDFALWKAAKPGEPAWDSPWGTGGPGWHIECSAMSLDLLGEGFDLHGGGDDLVFPHHENERAQAEARGPPVRRATGSTRGMVHGRRREDGEVARQLHHARRRARRVRAARVPARRAAGALPRADRARRRRARAPRPSGRAARRARPPGARRGRRRVGRARSDDASRLLPRRDGRRLRHARRRWRWSSTPSARRTGRSTTAISTAPRPLVATVLELTGALGLELDAGGSGDDGRRRDRRAGRAARRARAPHATSPGPTRSATSSPRAASSSRTRPAAPSGTAGVSAAPSARRRPRRRAGRGVRAVEALLAAGRRRVRSVWIAPGREDHGRLDEIERLAAVAGVRVRHVDRARLEGRARTEAPQGVVAFAAPVAPADLDELLGDPTRSSSRSTASPIPEPRRGPAHRRGRRRDRRGAPAPPRGAARPRPR